jgi:hypothetical protein
MWVNGVNFDLMATVCAQYASPVYSLEAFSALATNGVQTGYTGSFTDTTAMQTFIDNLVAALGFPWVAVGTVSDAGGDWGIVAVNLRWAREVVDSSGNLTFELPDASGSGSDTLGYAPYASASAAVAAIQILTGNVAVTS